MLKGTKIGVNSAYVYLMYLVLMPLFCLTHWRRVTHYTSVKSGIIGTDNHLNQCCLIVNFTLRNKLEWNFNQNSSIFIQENTFENVVCEMAAILSRGRLVNETISSDMCCIHITMPMFYSIANSTAYLMHNWDGMEFTMIHGYIFACSLLACVSLGVYWLSNGMITWNCRVLF